MHYWNLNTLITPTQNTLLSLTLNTKNLIFPKDRRMANMIRPNQQGETENKRRKMNPLALISTANKVIT